jgi:hypothetical protein
MIVAIATPNLESAQAQSRSHGHGGLSSSHGSGWSGHPPVAHPPPGDGRHPPIYGAPIVLGWWPYPYAYGYGYPVTTVPPLPPPFLGAFPGAGQTGFFPTMIPPIVEPPARNAAPRPRNRDTTRAKELTELGDRLFRAGNLIRATERYEQAIRSNPDRAEPRVRLAHIAVVRGKYQDAANKLREAQTAEPGWLANPGDLQGVFPEPAEFDRQVANLEAHLQARPDDRDAWLVLGSLWYLSGRTQKASDIFLRLSDRREEPTLRAFLQATKADGNREVVK